MKLKQLKLLNRIWTLNKYWAPFSCKYQELNCTIRGEIQPFFFFWFLFFFSIWSFHIEFFLYWTWPLFFLNIRIPHCWEKISDTCFQFCKIKCNYIDLKQLRLEGSNFLYIKIHGLKKRSKATLLTRATYMLACGKRLSCSSSVCSLFRCLYTVFYDCVRTARWDLSGDRAHVHGRVIVSLW
jgi:hypothetical protein